MGWWYSSSRQPGSSVTVRVTTARVHPSIPYGRWWWKQGGEGANQGDKDWWVRLWGSSIIISQVWRVWDSSLSQRDSLVVWRWMGGGERREGRCYRRAESNQFGGTRLCRLRVTADTELTRWLKLYTTARQEPLERERVLDSEVPRLEGGWLFLQLLWKYIQTCGHAYASSRKKRFVGGEINSGATVKDAHEHKYTARSCPDIHMCSQTPTHWLGERRDWGKWF